MNVRQYASQPYQYSTYRTALMAWLVGLVGLLPITPSWADSATPPALPNCVYVASYAPGYAWQDGITRSIQATLKGRCQLKTFFMDSKRVFDPDHLKKIGQQAAEFIHTQDADVVIVSDDHAIQYVLQPHFKNHDLPFVFCGVNRTGKGYGLPYSNTTGMIERNSIEEMLRTLFSIDPSKTHVAFITTLGITANKDVREFQQIAEKLHIRYIAYQAKNQNEWRRIYRQLQHDPQINLILFSNNAAFEEWDHETNLAWIKRYNHKLTLATQLSMMPYVALGMNKVPEEQGEWAANSAMAILDGVAPNQIQVVPNRRFLFWINEELITPFLDRLPDSMLAQSLRYRTEAAQ